MPAWRGDPGMAGMHASSHSPGANRAARAVIPRHALGMHDLPAVDPDVRPRPACRVLLPGGCAVASRGPGEMLDGQPVAREPERTRVVGSAQPGGEGLATMAILVSPAHDHGSNHHDVPGS